jgi:flagellar biosynthesis protein FlhB
LSDDKTELPTAERIQELREKGIISYSARSSACIVLVALMVLYSRDAALIETLRNLVFQLQNVNDLNKLVTLSQQLFLLLLLAPMIVTVVVILLWGLVQSKFLFKMGLFSIDFTRLAPRCSFSLATLSRTLAKNLFTLFMAICCVGLIWTSIAVRALAMLQASPEKAVMSFFVGIGQGFPLAVIVLGFVSLVLLLIEKLRFALDNRMTRKEARSEQ